MNPKAIDEGARRGRIYAKREKWVEPFMPAPTKSVGHMESMVKHPMQYDVLEGESRRFVYGFRTAAGDEIEPHIVNSVAVHEGSGIFPGGVKLERIKEVLREVPQELAQMKGDDDTVELAPSADMYTDNREFRAVF